MAAVIASKKFLEMIDCKEVMLYGPKERKIPGGIDFLKPPVETHVVHPDEMPI